MYIYIYSGQKKDNCPYFIDTRKTVSVAAFVPRREGV